MSEFIEYSKGVITNFLQTVVIVDDEAFFNEDCQSPTQISTSTELPAAIGRGTTRARKKQTSVEDNKLHQLNAKKLSDGFAQKGLLCTTLRPTGNEIQVYKDILKKADIVILDWKLKSVETDGETAKALIKSIIQDTNGNTQKSLRNIVIYSGENNLKDKIKLVKNYLDNELGEPEMPDVYSLIYDNLQIKIYAKEATQRYPKDEDVLKDEKGLVESIINDFTSQVAGLIPNMALQSLAELRKNTHKILGVFSKELDEAYLSHRMLLPHPKDAENFMLDIFISEIQSILEDNTQVNTALNIDQIMKWFNKYFSDERYKRFFLDENYQFNNNDDNNRIINTFDLDASCDIGTDDGKNKIIENKEKLLELLQNIFENGYCNLNDKKECDPAINCRLLEAKKKKPIKDLTKYLFSDNNKAEKLEKELSILSTIKKQYDSPEPIMTLGTVIKKQYTDSYFICIVPRCDAARIKCGTAPFIILPLTLREETATNKKFELIIQDNKYRKFAIDYKTENLAVIILKKKDGFDTEPLLAKKEGDFWYFFDDKDNKYIWISNLKRDKAQAILNKFAAQLSRVGFNESEYLRRSYQ